MQLITSRSVVLGLSLAASQAFAAGVTATTSALAAGSSQSAMYIYNTGPDASCFESLRTATATAEGDYDRCQAIQQSIIDSVNMAFYSTASISQAGATTAAPQATSRASNSSSRKTSPTVSQTSMSLKSLFDGAAPTRIPNFGAAAAAAAGAMGVAAAAFL